MWIFQCSWRKSSEQSNLQFCFAVRITPPLLLSRKTRTACALADLDSPTFCTYSLMTAKIASFSSYLTEFYALPTPTTAHNNLYVKTGLAWGGAEIHKCTPGKETAQNNPPKHQPHRFGKRAIRIQEARFWLCLHFAFSIYCSKRLFCRTHMALHQLYLQKPKVICRGKSAEQLSTEE